MTGPTIFVAKKIITMDVNRPVVTAVAILNERIVGLGDEEELAAMEGACVDHTFRNSVLVPGFVEGHSHLATGAMWEHVYVGYFDRVDPDGKTWQGLRSMDAVVGRLQEAHALSPDKSKPLIAWGFDPIYFGGERMTVDHLALVTTSRPILVLHQTFHTLNVNTAVLQAAGIEEDADVEGLYRGADGKPTGELREFALMFLAMEAVDAQPMRANTQEQHVWAFSRMAVRTGTTTACDMANPLTDETLTVLDRVSRDPAFPLRLVPLLIAFQGDPRKNVERIPVLRQYNNPKLSLGRVKIITDGAITGYTARLLPPGHYNGAPNGQWNLTPDSLKRLIREFHCNDIQMHIHANGDEASELTLDVLEDILPSHPRPGVRHTIQHCQMMGEAQFNRAKALGVTTNLFINHLFYYGDVHYKYTLGPQRASQLDAAATALRSGLSIAIHSDSPVTPLAPLFSAWVAVNRTTAEGRVLGAEQALTVEESLYAITMGAAYSLQLENEIGSISPGKYADFAILEDDPYDVPAQRLKDIAIRGTIVGGRPYMVEGLK